MRELPDLILAYGISDEYSFVFHKDCNLFERRAAKLVTTVATTFTSYFIHLWPKHFPDKALTPPMPSFDGRAVMYPSVENLRDYMSWRQVDCMLNFFPCLYFFRVQRFSIFFPSSREVATVPIATSDPMQATSTTCTTRPSGRSSIAAG